MSVEEMKSDMRNNKVDLAKLTIDELGIYATPDMALKLSTLHNAWPANKPIPKASSKRTCIGKEPFFNWVHSLLTGFLFSKNLRPAKRSVGRKHSGMTVGRTRGLRRIQTQQLPAAVAFGAAELRP
jgi:hypothetical protein